MARAVVLVAALLLAACQGGAPASTGPSGGSSPASEPEPSTAPDGPAITVASAAAVGEHLVDAEGMTLYVFLNDVPGMSHCTDDCAASWPPLLVQDGGTPAAGDGVSAELGTIDRGGGELQVTLDGWPLYRYAADSAPGDVHGEGVGEVWYVARPDGSLPQAGASQEPDTYY